MTHLSESFKGFIFFPPATPTIHSFQSCFNTVSLQPRGLQRRGQLWEWWCRCWEEGRRRRGGVFHSDTKAMKRLVQWSVPRVPTYVCEHEVQLYSSRLRHSGSIHDLLSGPQWPLLNESSLQNSASCTLFSLSLHKNPFLYVMKEGKKTIIATGFLSSFARHPLDTVQVWQTTFPKWWSHI